MGGGAGAWRAVAAAAVALWLVPAVLALAILWLPPVCCAVAAVRFVRVRRRLLVASTSSSRRAEEMAMVDDNGGGRLRLLHQYLDDQMELVGGHDDEGHPLLADPTAKQH